MPNLIVVNVAIAPVTGACTARSSDPAGLTASAADFATLIAALPAQASSLYNLDPTEWGAKPDQWQIEVRTRVLPP